ncbi:pentapeptide repeat-containing protein [Nonomuraea sp. NPDC050451]|uniref:pentapeptide repeat-containing protein n=1 Tax=Nonomuraea sp. NPDC050451 TaxID=3364364 RepID=UPI0037893202
MNAFERFTFEPSNEAWRSARIARGEPCDQRLQPPPGVTDAIFDRARLVNVDFTETRFPRFLAYGSEFDGCDFSGAAFEELSMGSTGTGVDGQAREGTRMAAGRLPRLRVPPHPFRRAHLLRQRPV